VARKIYEMHQDSEIILADNAVPDKMTEAFLARFGSRLRLTRGDIRDPAFLRSLCEHSPPTHVVHGAAITHDAAKERADPVRFIDINLNARLRRTDDPGSTRRTSARFLISANAI
jgi:nucleoside-diphosphate-sugar epimerase